MPSSFRSERALLRQRAASLPDASAGCTRLRRRPVDLGHRAVAKLLGQSLRDFVFRANSTTPDTGRSSRCGMPGKHCRPCSVPQVCFRHCFERGNPRRHSCVSSGAACTRPGSDCPQSTCNESGGSHYHGNRVILPAFNGGADRRVGLAGGLKVGAILSWVRETSLKSGITKKYTPTIAHPIRPEQWLPQGVEVDGG